MNSAIKNNILGKSWVNQPKLQAKQNNADLTDCAGQLWE
jgi:hypothetical protein